MKKLLSAAVAVSLLASAGVASAQSYDRPDGRYDGRVMDQRGDWDRSNDRDRGGYDNRAYDHRDGRGYDARGDRGDYRAYRHGARRYDAGRYHAPRGYQHREWRRGDRLPMSYRSSAYRVDYHRYGLRAPPRGYGYSRVDNDVVLTALATGVIAAVMVDMFN